MTPGSDKFENIALGDKLMELVKLEYSMKKHFVYIDHIEELRHKESVIRDFDKAINLVTTLENEIKRFRISL